MSRGQFFKIYNSRLIRDFTQLLQNALIPYKDAVNLFKLLTMVIRIPKRTETSLKKKKYAEKSIYIN